MMKILTNIFFLLVIHQFVHGQITDTVPSPTRDTANIPTDRIPVLADTIQYNDTTVKKTASGKDTAIVKKKVHSPRTATLRSAILPGWGQIYNKKYWKLPLVYAGIGIPAYTFFNNKQWYTRVKYALAVVLSGSQGNTDSMARVHPQLVALVNLNRPEALVNYRNEFRRDMDYSILFTLLMWGLNVVDATVDGHLKGFDVGDELSMRIKPSLITGSLTPGISLVVSFK
jgi:hypothetical protein